MQNGKAASALENRLPPQLSKLANSPPAGIETTSPGEATADSGSKIQGKRHLIRR